ncbi:Nn.00g047780.m01.CDS01 [Neocucurbitaria sp. VM-36]
MYRPIGDPNHTNSQSAPLDNIELNTRYDAGTYNYAPPTGTPPDRDIKDVDSKAAFRSGEVPVSSWPVHSQRAAALTPLRISLMIFDAILASTPIMFVALALTAARLDGKEVSQYGYRLTETLLLSPTIFPLIFAALMGRFFRHLGVYLAERGTTLGRLEQLVGCQSVFSALERQFCLRSWSVVGLLSIVVWLLSPVGGQSALRLLGQESNDITSTSTVRYMDPQTISSSVIQGASSANSGRSTFTSIFLAALLSSSKYQATSMDLWGNIKLPIYRYIENNTSDEWKQISNTTGANVTYASLIGVPIVGPPSNGYTTFNIKARQFDITCSSNELMGKNESGFGNMTATWKLRPLNQSKNCGNVTDCAVPDCDGYPCPILSKSLANEDDPDNTTFSVASCEISFDYFESGVRCNGTSCAVYQMRKLDLFGDGYTEDEDDFTRNNYIGNEMTFLPTLDNYNVGSAAARGSTNMEKWMMDPTNFIGARYDNVELHRLSPEVFAERLTILYNTFFQSTYGTLALGGHLPSNLTQTGLIVGPSYGTNVTFNGTEANLLQESKPVYKTNWKWFTALLVCSLVLLIAAYVGLVLKYITLAPDIIGYASSLTLLNPYVPTPTGGTTLHGLERAALLHDLPVRIGDVCANEPVGAIAFAKADNGRVARLDRKRYYI